MQKTINGTKMYCDSCTDDEGKPAETEMHGSRWACPRCGETRIDDPKPLECTVCNGPWPECFEGCKLFEN